MNRPTENAQFQFNSAGNALIYVLQGKADATAVPKALHYMSRGLHEMATGLRATYVKLEQLEALIRSQSVPSRRP